MNKRILAMVLVAALTFAGCSLATEKVREEEPQGLNWGPTQSETDGSSLMEIRQLMGGGASGDDLFVGMLITLDHFYTPGQEGYTPLPEWNAADTGMNEPLHYASNQGKRLYAQKSKTAGADGVEWDSWVFPEGAGISFFLCFANYETFPDARVRTEAGPEIGDHQSYLNSGLDCDAVALEGKLYVDKNATDLAIFCNPVFESREGEIYALGATPCGYHAVSMTGCSQTIRQQIDTMIGTRKINGVSVTLEIETETLPKGYAVVEWDDDHNMVKKTEYAPGELPDEFYPSEKTAYLVLETYTEDGTTRKVFSPGDLTQIMVSFGPTPVGILRQQGTDIIWEVEP